LPGADDLKVYSIFKQMKLSHNQSPKKTSQPFSLMPSKVINGMARAGFSLLASNEAESAIRFGGNFMVRYPGLDAGIFMTDRTQLHLV